MKRTLLCCLFVLLAACTTGQKDTKGKEQTHPASTQKVLAGVVDLGFAPLSRNAPRNVTLFEYRHKDTDYRLAIVPLYTGTTVSLYAMPLVNAKLTKAAQPFLRYALPENTHMVLNTTLPEGLPSLSICVQAKEQEACWQVRYNGKDTSLLLDPGFTQIPLDAWKKGQTTP